MTGAGDHIIKTIKSFYTEMRKTIQFQRWAVAYWDSACQKIGTRVLHRVVQNATTKLWMKRI